MIRIAVDAMGGDHAPSAIVDGAVAAARHLDSRSLLVGADGRDRRRRSTRTPTGATLGDRRSSTRPT